MRQNYTGSLYACGDDLQVLIDNGISVRAKIDGRWIELKSEADLDDPAVEFGTENIFLSYRIPAYKYALVCAREREADELRWQEIRRKAEQARRVEYHDPFDMAAECIEGYIYEHQIAPDLNF